MRRLDVHTANESARAELDDAPVVCPIKTGLAWQKVAAAARFPAVHPLPAVGVFAVAPDGCFGEDQAFLRGEELVAGGNDTAAQPLRRQVYQVDEVVAHSICPQPALTRRSRSHTRSPRR